MKRLAVLGSTGSIGRQTLELVRAFPDRFAVTALAAGHNAALLAEQIREFRPALYNALAPVEAPAFTRRVSLDDVAAAPEVELVVVATAGKAGLGPTLAALKAGKEVALSNKEALVMAGELVMAEAKAHGVTIRPVDSEHSAVWQCLAGEGRPLRRLYLTASGGPFYRLSRAELGSVTVEQALRHPTWKMGRKVTIDSATLMNKGLEVMEAHWLFDTPVENIEVLVHPQSMVHALVEFPDGAVKAQLAPPDMRLPIQYALTWPERLPNAGLPRLDLARAGALTFEPPDLDRFPCLRLALEAARLGGTYPAALCAADEVAVELFLNGRAWFHDIAVVVEETMKRHRGAAHPSLDEVMEADTLARETALKVAAEVARC